MLHNLTIGHLDTTHVAERRSRVLKPLEADVVDRHLQALGTRDGEDWLLGNGKLEFRDGCLVVPWMGGRVNHVAEEFVLRMMRDTGCQAIDREHGRVVTSEQLVGLPETQHRPKFTGLRGELRGSEKG